MDTSEEIYRALCAEHPEFPKLKKVPKDPQYPQHIVPSQWSQIRKGLNATTFQEALIEAAGVVETMSGSEISRIVVVTYNTGKYVLDIQAKNLNYQKELDAIQAAQKKYRNAVQHIVRTENDNAASITEAKQSPLWKQYAIQIGDIRREKAQAIKALKAQIKELKGS